MNNIVQLTVPSRILPLEARLGALLACFAEHRRTGDDVFWLKENAELLNILECTGQEVPAEALAIHAGFYANAHDRLTFFPQYYRFLLSLALDLEALGMPGNEAARMVEFARREGLAEAELSDLQRAEARRLMGRRGVDPIRDPGLDDRLRAFTSRTATFQLPNKKAAYELTHIVYYLSEYGRRPPDLPQEALDSLHFAGLTAFLDQNADLLAEICIALRHAGQVPPAVWTAWLEAETMGFTVESGPGVALSDNYHEFLICNWHQAVTGGPLFRKPVAPGRMRFDRAARPRTALREISQAMLAMEEGRSGDWERMRARVAPHLSEEARDLLEVAAQSSALFGAYFEGFARAGRS
ncbi:DUF6902 family protein [Pseudoponticoccus marisrubri]|uniref:Uncharacterized protein n=1 Tax=Pseudoponticoccus marisrubri TaxID=1685382 RepID=A0A0W7WMU4_9RHOB|nr:hypothetical protein [Pseudoponticoccus marisrubri]KUF11899.1 hypothetical protein AVJ23_04775 [Pseudoponticoccus marisrubri]